MCRPAFGWYRQRSTPVPTSRHRTGPPDSDRNIKPGANATEQEIIDFCKIHLAMFKVPTAVDFRKELPKTLVGKVLRRVLVEEEKAKLSTDA